MADHSEHCDTSLHVSGIAVLVNVNVNVLVKFLHMSVWVYSVAYQPIISYQKQLCAQIVPWVEPLVNDALNMLLLSKRAKNVRSAEKGILYF